MVGTTEKVVNKRLARKYLGIVDCGLTSGMGEPEPGKFCVEAALCFALGMEHGDEPKCVGSAVRQFKMCLNDSGWSNNKARAKGLRRAAIAQLGSNEIDQRKFAVALDCLIIQRVIPVALRLAAQVHPNETHKAAMVAAANRCESEGTQDAAIAASYAASAASAASYASAAWASARAAASAASAASAAARGASAAACEAACDAACDARAKDKLLATAAECAVEALIECGSPGCKWLDICGPHGILRDVT